MKIVNDLRFRDSRDSSFADAEIKRFIETFINIDKYSKIEITKDYIYLYEVGESGYSHFTFYGLKPTTSREMIIYITALNNSNFTKGLYNGK